MSTTGAMHMNAMVETTRARIMVFSPCCAAAISA
jgi:hypothetical protein